MVQPPGAGGAIQTPRPQAWVQHFDVPYVQEDRRARLVRDLQGFLVTLTGWIFLVELKLMKNNAAVIKVDYEALLAASGIADLPNAMQWAPLEALACISIAVYEVLVVLEPRKAEQITGGRTLDPKVAVRMHNHLASIKLLRDFNSSALIGRLATVRGAVIRATSVTPLVTVLPSGCAACETTTPHSFPDGVYQPATSCGTKGCRGRTLEPVRSEATSVDWRRLRIQEEAGADADDAGRIPRTVEVEVSTDLVDSASVGDTVEVLGIVCAMEVSSSGPGAGVQKGPKRTLELMYVSAISVTVLRATGRHVNNPSATGQENEGEVEPGVSLKTLHFIVQFSEQYAGRQLKHLVHALAPSIVGHELVKMGILLSMMGGVAKGGVDASKGGDIPLRGDIHTLIVGDPGLGKSQLLQAAAAAAPQGMYVCGHTASRAGLTCAVVRDSISGAFELEAGALVLASGGLCCIDEFDKMSADYQALLVALEQGEVSVAKGATVGVLPAHTTVVAAANPVAGSYCRSKTVVENVNMPRPLLSRFDLVFLLLDTSDAQRDRQLSEHVVALHSGDGTRVEAARLAQAGYAPVRLLTAGGETADVPPLAQRLLMGEEDTHEPLPVELLQKYIAYARLECSPRLGEAAQKLLIEHWLEMRAAVALSDNCMPVTPRQLEGLIRLAEARAKVELAPEVTLQHAQDIIDLVRDTSADSAVEEAGPALDFSSSSGSRSKQAEARRFLDALERAGIASNSASFSITQLYSLADRISLQVEVHPLIEALNEAGELLQRGQQVYEVDRVRHKLSRRSR